MAFDHEMALGLAILLAVMLLFASALWHLTLYKGVQTTAAVLVATLLIWVYTLAMTAEGRAYTDFSRW